MNIVIIIAVCAIIVVALLAFKGKGGDDLGEVSDETIRSLIQSGQLIQAIKAYRKLYGTGLKESKEQVERIAAELARQPEAAPGKLKEKADIKERL